MAMCITVRDFSSQLEAGLRSYGAVISLGPDAVTSEDKDDFGTRTPRRGCVARPALQQAPPPSNQIVDNLWVARP